MTRPLLHWILDDDGNPRACEDVMEWGRWMDAKRDADELCVGEDLVVLEGVNLALVMTGFRGIPDVHDLVFQRQPPLTLWETVIVYGGSDRRYDGCHWPNAEMARAGHAQIVDRLRRGLSAFPEVG